MTVSPGKSIKANEIFRVASAAIEGWLAVESQRGSHVKLVHEKARDFIIFPNHGSKEVGKGLEKKIRKQAGLLK